MSYWYEATRFTFHFYTDERNHVSLTSAPKRYAVLWPEEHPHTLVGRGF